MDSKRNFFSTINFLYKFGKFFGLSCYSISKGPTNYKVSFGITDFLQFVLFVSVYFNALYNNCVNEWKITNDEKNTVIFNSGQQILTFTSLVCLVLVTFLILLMRHKFWDISNSLEDIDNQMMVLLNIQINYNDLYRQTVIYTSIGYAGLLLVYSGFAYYFYIIEPTWLWLAQHMMSFVLPNGAFTLLTIQFQVLMYSIYLRFSRLNEFVESNMLQTTNGLLSLSHCSEFEKNIFRIAKITDLLNCVVPKLCYYFGGPMMVATSGVFGVTVFNFHNFYRIINGRLTNQFYLLMLIYDLLSVLFSIWVVVCLTVSHFNTSSLKIFSQQILHQTPDFSFGLVSLNWPFAYSYTASVATYIVILIQFENYITDSANKSI